MLAALALLYHPQHRALRPMVAIPSLKVQMRMRPLVFAALVASRAAIAQTSAARIAYPDRQPPSAAVRFECDAKFDKTVLRLGPLPLDSTLALSALVALDGCDSVHKAAPGVVLTLWSTSPVQRFQTDRTLRIRRDGAVPDSLRPAQLVSQPRPGFTEVMMGSMSLDLWLAIAQSRKVEITVGTQSYVLSPEVVAAIRDFASRMAPGRAFVP